MVSRHVLHRVPAVIVALGALFASTPVVAAASPSVVHEQAVFGGADLGVVNICGDLADFTFSWWRSFTRVEQSDGDLHLQVVTRGTYTVDFADPALPTWTARITAASSLQVTPGGSFVLTDVANSREGPVRIHEQTTFVTSADGTVRVDADRFTFDGCS